MDFEKYLNLVKKDFKSLHNLIWIKIGTPVRAMTGRKSVIANIILVLGYMLANFFALAIIPCFRAGHAGIESAAKHKYLSPGKKKSDISIFFKRATL